LGSRCYSGGRSPKKKLCKSKDPRAVPALKKKLGWFFAIVFLFADSVNKQKFSGYFSEKNSSMIVHGH
jgi:hypothetical protein